MSIRQFESSDAKAVQNVYITEAKQTEVQHILKLLGKSASAKRTWQAGLIGLWGVHLSLALRTGSIVNAIRPTPLLLVEWLLWSAGVGMAWYIFLCNEYRLKVMQRGQRIAKEYERILKLPKSDAWVMVQDELVVGAVALEYTNGQGRIQSLTAATPQTWLALVQNAMQFARQNDIKVVAKWGDDAK